MKRIIFCMAMLCSLSSYSQTYFGDVNHDGKIDINDITHLVNIVLGKNKAEEIQIENNAVKNTWSYTINGVEYPMPEAVDLGLPSGTKWASMNIGAKSQDDFGMFFSWADPIGYLPETNKNGSVTTSHCFDIYNYTWMDVVIDREKNDATFTLQKYCTNSSKGIVDNLTTIDTNDDAANVNLGEDWRMPTGNEAKELIDNCTFEITTFNNIRVAKLTGTNGNYIYLPTPGYIDNCSLGLGDWATFYWSSSLDVNETSDYYANILYISTNGDYQNIRYENFTRWFGGCIRPVKSN